jgi:uncharacterized membrane protein YqjE
MLPRQTDQATLGSLLNSIGRTTVGCLENRGELLAVEWQEEKAHVTELLICTVGVLFTGIMTALLLTATIVFLFPPQWRIYALGGFTLLYFIGGIVAWGALKRLLKHQPFSESLNQVKKDAVWLESLK